MTALVEALKPLVQQAAAAEGIALNDVQGWEEQVQKFGRGVEAAAGLPAILEALEFIAKHPILASKLVAAVLFHGGLGNDRNGLLEMIIKLLVDLTPGSQLLALLVQFLLKHLWESIEKPYHPVDGSPLPSDPCVPPSNRTPGGFQYSTKDKKLGATGSIYAKTVANPTTLDVLPDPSVVFNKLFARQAFQGHPNYINELLFNLAALITHDLFWTDDHDKTKRTNLASSYVDLSPLYGNTADITTKLRQGQQDGRIAEDAIGDVRVLLQMSGVLALLVCFSRNHNWIAKRLLELDEGKRFSSIQDPQKRSDALFETARLINCGCYANLVLLDYVRAILDVPLGSNFTLDPRELRMEPTDDHDGNLVSIEFNFIYRWHPCISQDGEAWVNALAQVILATGQHPKSFEDVVKIFFKGEPDAPYYASLSPPMPRTDFGPHPYAGLGDILKKSIKARAGRFGPHNTPYGFQPFEIQAILQGRELKVCSLNDFRKTFKLQPYKTFEDLTGDTETAQVLSGLYNNNVDNVELYVGITVEETKAAIKDKGLATNFTTSRAILSDAVNLIRNDRYYNEAFTPANLTQWGYNMSKGLYKDPLNSDSLTPVESFERSLAPLILVHGGVTDPDILSDPFHVPVADRTE